MFKLVELENDYEYIIVEGTYNDCVSEFEAIYGREFYQGIEIGVSLFYIEDENGEEV